MLTRLSLSYLPLAPGLVLALVGGFALAGATPGGVTLGDATPGDAIDPGPRFEWIGSNNHDFGPVISGEFLDHVFSFFSTGESALVVTELETDCACTTFEPIRVDGTGARTPYELGTPLPPGEAIELRVHVDTTEKFGTLAFNVRIKTNSAEHPITAARTTAESLTPFQIDPKPLPLGSLTPGQEAGGSMRITNIFAEPCRIEIEEHPFREFIDAELEPVDPDEAGLALAWDLKIGVHGELPEKGNDFYPIKLKSTLPDKPRFATANEDGSTTFHFTALIAADVIPWVGFSPRKVEFGRLWAKRTYTRSAVIENHDKEFELSLDPADVALVGYDGPFAWAANTTVSLHEIEKGRVQITITVKDLPQRMKAPFQGYLSISTGHPKLPKIEIPVSGLHR